MRAQNRFRVASTVALLGAVAFLFFSTITYAQSPSSLRPPTYFVDGRKADPPLLSLIQQGMDETGGKWLASSVVSCGTACDSFWFVDRRTGAVAAAPKNSFTTGYEFILGARTKRGSDVVSVIYGTTADATDKCLALRYRWAGGKTFDRISTMLPVRCP
jgi:hypothetical protein